MTTSAPRPTPRYRATALVVAGRIPTTMTADQNRNQSVRWKNGSSPRRKRRATRDSANTAKATRTTWMALMVASSDEPPEDQLGGGLDADEEALPLGHRVLGVDGRDGDLRQPPAPLLDLLDELRGDLHAVGAQVDHLGRPARQPAQPALAVGHPDAEERVGEDVAHGVEEDPAQRHL